MKAFVFLPLLFPLAAQGAAEWRQSFHLRGESRRLDDNALNPGNRVWLLPQRFVGVESRTDLRLTGEPLVLSIRPRLEATQEKVNDKTTNEASAHLQEAYLQVNLRKNLDVKVGRVQFGWGPAESITPSNWLAPEVQFEASPQFEQLGVYRAQGSWSPSQQLSLIAAHELRAPDDRADSRPEIAERNRRRFLTKAEVNWDNGSKIIGATGGTEKEPAAHVYRAGGYGSWTLSDAWQIYADAAWRKERHRGKWQPLTVGGIRYTFENGAEVRLEGIYNDRGATRAQRSLAYAQLLANPALVTRALLMEQSETLSGRGYGYAAFRWTNSEFFPASMQSPSLALRALRSFTDQSQVVIGSFETGFLDRFLVYVYGGITSGPDQAELRSFSDQIIGAGLSVSL